MATRYEGNPAAEGAAAAKKDDAERAARQARPRTKTIDGYRIQPLMPLHFPYLGGMVESAVFTRYDGADCVEVEMRIGLVKNPYCFWLSIPQALDADIIERV